MAKWIITKDFINESDWNPQVGTTGSQGEPDKENSVRFRLKDDDDTVYYEGLCDDSSSEEAFEPLDDFGMPNDGCTSIEYFENGKWEVL